MAKRETLGKDPFEWIKNTKKTSKPVRRQADKPVKQHTSKPVSQHTGKLVKATFYLLPKQIIDLEKIRLDSLQPGKAKIDKSALVRQAIEMLVSQHTSKPAKQ